MKNIFISEKQKRYINEASEIRQTPVLPSHLLKSENPFSKSDLLINGFIEKSLNDQFKNVVSEFTDDITSYDNNVVNSELGKLLVKCAKIEAPIRSNLEKICLNCLIDEFKIPNDCVNFDAKLCDAISPSKTFHIKPDVLDDFEYDSIDSMNKSDFDAEKRKLIDAIIVGASMDVSKRLMKKCIGDIFELDESLPHLYSKIMKINDYLIFSSNFSITDDSHKQGGYVEVRLGDDTRSTKITASGIIFPILLQECVKGLMELWSSNGLPENPNDAEAAINKADALENDPWYMRIGPQMWGRIKKHGVEIDEYFPTFMDNFVTLSDNDFKMAVKEIMAGTKLGGRIVNDIYEKSKYSDDYKSFEYDIMSKSKDSGLIEDDYFSDDELKKWGNYEI